MNYKNTLTIIGKDEEITSVMKSIGSKTIDQELMYIDFNKIIEMPIGLNIEFGTESDIARQLLFGESFYYEGYSREQAWKEIATYTRNDQNKSILSAIQIQENIQKTGHAYSHSWIKENWGTEGNAHSQKLETENVITFKTDGSPATKLIKILSSKFDGLHFIHEYNMIDEYCVDLSFMENKVNNLDEEDLPF